MMTKRPGYSSDLTDGQWEILRPLIPSAKHGGRPRKTDMRAVVDAIHDALRDKVRRKAGKDPQPTAAIIDSQSSRTTEKEGSRAATTRARK